MNKLFVVGALSIILFCSSKVQAQDAKDGMIRLAKVDRPCVQADYPYVQSQVQSALDARLASLGKNKSQKGFQVYEGVNWPEIAAGQVDVYTKVEEHKGISTVYILVSKGYDNYISMTTDSVMVAKVKQILVNLTPGIKDAQHLEQVAAQEEAVRKAEKNFNESKHSLDRLQSERDNLDKRIGDMKNQNSDDQNALSAEKKKLEDLKAGH